jgi:hypothetical protein
LTEFETNVITARRVADRQLVAKRGRASTAAPTAAPAAPISDEPDDEKQHDRADGGIDDRADNSDTKMETELRHQPVANEGADNPDYHVTNEPKAGPLDDLTGQPPGS